MIVIILYVDDLVIGGVNIVAINKVKSLLSGKFEMTDMKELHYFLGIEVIQTSAGIMTSQRHHIECKHVVTPLDQNLKLDDKFGTERVSRLSIGN